eukprot:201244_1
MSYNLLVASVIAATTESIKEQKSLEISKRLTQIEYLKDCISVCIKTLISYLDNRTATNFLSITEIRDMHKINWSETFDSEYCISKITTEYKRNYDLFKKEYVRYINSVQNGEVKIWIPMIQIWNIEHIVNESLLNKYGSVAILFHLCLTEKLMFDLLDKYTEVEGNDEIMGKNYNNKPYSQLHKIIDTKIENEELNSMINKVNINNINHFRSHYIKIGSLLDVLVKKSKSFDAIFDSNTFYRPFGGAKNKYRMIQRLRKLLLIPLIDPLVNDWLVIDGKLGSYSLSMIFGYISPKCVIVIAGVYNGKVTLSFF